MARVLIFLFALSLTAQPAHAGSFLKNVCALALQQNSGIAWYLNQMLEHAAPRFAPLTQPEAFALINIRNQGASFEEINDLFSVYSGSRENLFDLILQYRNGMSDLLKDPTAGFETLLTQAGLIETATYWHSLKGQGWRLKTQIAPFKSGQAFITEPLVRELREEKVLLIRLVPGRTSYVHRFSLALHEMRVRAQFATQSEQVKSRAQAALAPYQANPEWAFLGRLARKRWSYEAVLERVIEYLIAHETWKSALDDYRKIVEFQPFSRVLPWAGAFFTENQEKEIARQVNEGFALSDGLIHQLTKTQI